MTKIEWIDGNRNPCLSNTNVRLLAIRNKMLTLAIYTPSDGWFDILAREEVPNGILECYARIPMPIKKVQTQEIITWE